MSDSLSYAASLFSVTLILATELVGFWIEKAAGRLEILHQLPKILNSAPSNAQKHVDSTGTAMEMPSDSLFGYLLCIIYKPPLEPKLLLCRRAHLLTLLKKIARYLMQSQLVYLAIFLYFFSEFPNSLRHFCTTMPWTIWPTLVILWGVCWMFYGSTTGDEDSFDDTSIGYSTYPGMYYIP